MLIKDTGRAVAFGNNAYGQCDADPRTVRLSEARIASIFVQHEVPRHNGSMSELAKSPPVDRRGGGRRSVQNPFKIRSRSAIELQDPFKIRSSAAMSDTCFLLRRNAYCQVSMQYSNDWCQLSRLLIDVASKVLRKMLAHLFQDIGCPYVDIAKAICNGIVLSGDGLAVSDFG